MSDLSVVLVDDERLAREQLRKMLGRCSGVRIVGEAEDSGGAIAMIREHEPDVVFLDIDLAGESAFGILDELDDQTRSRIVFVTAFDQFAIRAFEVNACDYLLKPVRQRRLEAALDRLHASTSSDPLPAEEDRPLTADDYVLLTTGQRSTFLKVDNIARIEAESPYSKVYARDGRTSLVPRSLAQWLERLPEALFVRVHRSTVVNVDCVERIEGTASRGFQVFLKNCEQPAALSRRYARRLKERF